MLLGLIKPLYDPMYWHNSITINKIINTFIIKRIS